MLCKQLGLARLQVSVVYFNVDTEVETPVSNSYEATALQAHFEALADHFLTWAGQELRHRGHRDGWLRTMRWPYPEYRHGQRHLATAVYNAVRSRRHLLAQAPTGIGKTLATLFPMLKAMPGHEDCEPLDKVFFLSAKTTGRRLALDGLTTLRSADRRGSPLRVMELVARDKACEHPDSQCHGDSCPLARGFYDRLPAARSEAVVQLSDGKVHLREVALRHQVCPYYLGQEMARWTDIVIADYNYFFDSSALLHALTVENQWRVAVLVDEAHNMVARARDMYSIELTPARLCGALKDAPQPLHGALKRLQRAWRKVGKSQSDDFQVHDQVPESLEEAIRSFTAKAGELLAQELGELSEHLRHLYFDSLRFASLAESFDANSQFDVTLVPSAGRRTNSATLCIRNVVPAPFLAVRLKATQASVFFSATLRPFNYQRGMLGLPDSAVELDVASPFSPDQLAVRVASDISTRYADRADSLSKLARLIVDQYTSEPGNYLAFFASFDYLDQVASAVRAMAPHLPIRKQDRRMTEVERQRFVDSFVPGGAQLGFAVLGGAFSEGIDLPGSRLVGAFVGTLGLAQVSPVNESVRLRMHRHFGDGYGYAYLYPGLQKVVQAAGRVIRTPQDRGVLWLMDDRFLRADVRALLPDWWHVQPCVSRQHMASSDIC